MLINKLIKSRNKVFISWLWSYVVVLIIPLIIGSLLYIQSVRVIDEEVNRAHDSSLEQLKTVLDGQLSEIQRISDELGYNYRLRKLIYQKKELTPESIIAMYELQKDIIKVKSTKSSLAGIYIYFRNGDYILSDSRRITDNDYERALAQEFGIDSAQWLDIVNSSASDQYRIIRIDDGNERVLSKVIYIHPVFGANLKKPDAAVVMLIEGQTLTHLLQDIQWTADASISIIDESNEFLSSDGMDTLPDFMRYDSLRSVNSMFKEKYLGDEVAVTHVKSAVNNWEYVSLIPTRVFLERVQYIKLMIYAYIGICLVVGCIMVLYFVRRNYRPLKKLTQIISKSNHANADINEFKYVEESMLRLLEEKASLTNKLAQQKDALRNNFLMRLLKGRITSELSASDSFEMYDISFASDDFAVMIFQIDTINDVLWEDKPEDDDLIHYILRHVNEGLLGDKFHGYMAEVDGMMCCLVNIHQMSEESERMLIKDEIERIALQAIELLETRFGLTVSVAISGLQAGIPGIAKAYSEAIEVMEYKKLVDDINPVIHFDTIFCSRKPGLEESVIFHKERQFTNCIIAKDYKCAGEILNDILVNDLLKATPSLQIVKCRLFGMLNTMLNVMGEIRVTMDSQLFDDVNMVARLMNSKSISAVQQQINYIFRKLSEYYQQEGTNMPINDKYAEIVDYLKSHYTDQNISVSGVSELFETSISSLSRMFKKNMGVGLLDYIHKLRLAKAKELLQATDLSIKDVAERTGYYNDVAIIRAFKRYEGITPGKYREMETVTEANAGNFKAV